MSVCARAYALHASSSILTVPSVDFTLDRISQRPLLLSAFKWRLNEIRVRLFMWTDWTRVGCHTGTHIETCYGIFARLESVAAPTHSESYVSGALCDYAIHKFIIEFIRSFDVLWFSFALLLLCDPLWCSDDMWGNADVTVSSALCCTYCERDGTCIPLRMVECRENAGNGHIIHAIYVATLDRTLPFYRSRWSNNHIDSGQIIRVNWLCGWR